jgi:outer membrane biosynthesis protein TonB
MSPVVIQRTVRTNFGKFRPCYEKGLARNADLTGRVMVRFMIDRDGKVSNVADGGSDLPDSEVVECVMRAFHSLEFPQPEDGIVTVVYPIMLAPR